LLPLGHASAEWYVAGYGGLSFGGKLHDVTMPDQGLRLAQQQFPSVLNPVTGDTVTQTFKTSNLSLANTAVYGAKVGYFFTREGYSWLGVELDAFTSKPDIKQQNVSTLHDITFTPKDTSITSPCRQLGTDCPQTVVNTGNLNIRETSLRVATLTANLIARYPGKVFQPYAGVGGGIFYFTSSGQFEGRQFSPGLNVMGGLKVIATEEWGLFVEGRYNFSYLSDFDPVFGLNGSYQAVHAVGGVSYQF
jgi:outer membrane protein W